MPEEPTDSTSEDFSVRLSWPEQGAPSIPVTPDRRGGSEAPAPSARGGAPRTVREVEVRAEPASIAVPGPPPATPALTGWRSADGPEPRPAPRTARLPEGLPVPAMEGVPTGRAFVEAFDRLADRLLDRLRTLRQDIDADLTGVRTELASLRVAVDELGDRSHLRSVETTVDDVRTELSALRRAVLEWPELEQVSNDVAAVRGDLAFLFQSGDLDGVAPPSALLEDLERATGTLSDEITRLGAELPQVSAVNAVLEEVTAVRAELTQVRRRMVLRSGPLDDEQLDQIVAAVASRVVEELQDPDGRRKRR